MSPLAQFHSDFDLPSLSRQISARRDKTAGALTDFDTQTRVAQSVWLDPGRRRRRITSSSFHRGNLFPRIDRRAGSLFARPLREVS